MANRSGAGPAEANGSPASAGRPLGAAWLDVRILRCAGQKTTTELAGVYADLFTQFGLSEATDEGAKADEPAEPEAEPEPEAQADPQPPFRPVLCYSIRTAKYSGSRVSGPTRRRVPPDASASGACTRRRELAPYHWCRSTRAASPLDARSPARFASHMRRRRLMRSCSGGWVANSPTAFRRTFGLVKNMCATPSETFMGAPL